MGNNYKMLKNWYKFAKPNKKFLFIQFSTVLLRYICWLIAAVFAAKATTCLSVQDWNGALINLSIDLAWILLSALSFTINYFLMNHLIGPIYKRTQIQILDKVINSSNKNFKKISKEKLINIVGNDSYAIAEFADVLAGRMARLARVIITIIIVFFISPVIGAITLLINILNYFILNYINERKSKVVKKIKETNDHLFQQFSEVVDSKDIITSLNIKNKIINNYAQTTDMYAKEKQRNNVYQSHIDNTFYSYYKFIVYLVSILLVFLMMKNKFDLTTYLVLVPYVLSSFEIANEALQILPKLKETNISCNRIKAIFKFTQSKSVPIGENEEDYIDGVISFDNVFYQGTKKNIPKLKHCNIHLRQNQTTIIYGERKCGKRTIFKLLSRQIKPTHGNITLSGINIYDFSQHAYSSNFNFTTTKPYMFKGSIMKNLKLIESNNKKIFEMCKSLNLHDSIISMPKKYNTNVDKLNTMQKFLLGLGRVFLTNSEVVAIYEIPEDLSKEDMDAVLNTLQKLRGTRTIIIFSAFDTCFEVADKIITIKNGEINDISFPAKSIN